MAIIVVFQDFFIFSFLSIFPPSDAPHLTMAEQGVLSMRISSFFTTIEMTFLLMLISKHFIIRTENLEEEYDDAYDELQGSILDNTNQQSRK